MTIYTFPNHSIKKLAQNKALSIYPLIVVILLGVFMIVNHLEDNEIMEDPALLVIMAGVGLFILVGGFFASIKSISKVLSETKFVLNENTIKKHIPNGKDIEILFKDIKNVHHSKNGMLIKAQNEQILIPIELTNFKDLEAVIKGKTKADLYSIGTKYKMNETLMKYLVGISFMAILSSFYLVEVKLYKLIIGVVILLVFIYGLYDGFKNKSEANVSSGMLAKLTMITLSLMAYLIYIALYT